MKNIPKLFLSLMLVSFFSMNISAQYLENNDKHIRFIDYPDFSKANSTWGSIGFNPVNNCVYIGVTNHKDKIGLYEYSVIEDTMSLLGFIGNMANLRNFQWQGKIHTKITFDIEGNAYFGTDGGESRQEYLMDHPHGYTGGFIMKWDKQNAKLINLGTPKQYESVKDIAIDQETSKIYSISYPQVHFLALDLQTNECIDYGRLGSSHVPRIMFTDKWGNCYYVDWRQRLVKYEKSSEKLLFAKESLPSFPQTPGEIIITGIKSFAKDADDEVIYLSTYGAKILAFHPQEKGIGPVEDLGPLFETNDNQPWKPYASNLNVGLNGNLYYFIGGHRNYVKKDTVVMMKFNPSTKRKEIVQMFPTSIISEVTGCGVRDKEGNLYFAGRKLQSQKKKYSELLPSIDDKSSFPFMILFNPEKELN